MNNRDIMIRDLDRLPEWDSSGEGGMKGSDPAIHLFTPDANAHWYLMEKDTSDHTDIRYFGLCDLGVGMPELGWVDRHSLLTVRGALGLPVEVETHVERTLADGYERVGEVLPKWINA